MRRCDGLTAIVLSLYGSQREQLANRHLDVRKGKKTDSTCPSSPEQASKLPKGVSLRICVLQSAIMC
jgi:hypothetical protein